AGTLTLGGDGSGLSGTTAVNAGSIKLGSANALAGSTVSVNVSGGLNLNGLASAALGGLAGANNLSLGATNLTVGGNNADAAYSGNIGSGTSLTKVGMGTLTLSGATRPYTGGTFLNAGTVSVSDDRNLGATSGGLTFGGGTLQVTASYSSTRAVTFNSGGGTI